MNKKDKQWVWETIRTHLAGCARGDIELVTLYCPKCDHDRVAKYTPTRYVNSFWKDGTRYRYFNDDCRNIIYTDDEFGKLPQHTKGDYNTCLTCGSDFVSATTSKLI